MSWVAVGVAAASMVVSYSAGQDAKKAAGKQASLEEQAGAQRQQAANFEASIMETQATARVAAAQRDMLDAQRVTALTQSRAQALAAASGGGASSPTALTVIGKIAKQGALNAGMALYNGEEQARTLRLQAVQTRLSGQFDAENANLQADVTRQSGQAKEMQADAQVISSAGGLYGKYGGRGPSGGGKTDYFQYTGYDASGGPAYG